MGDFVDRGFYSVETFLLLLALKVGGRDLSTLCDAVMLLDGGANERPAHAALGGCWWGGWPERWTPPPPCSRHGGVGLVGSRVAHACGFPRLWHLHPAVARRPLRWPQVRYPERIMLIRGNHESRQITQVGTGGGEAAQLWRVCVVLCVHAWV
jgi:hypothetical protein